MSTLKQYPINQQTQRISPYKPGSLPNVGKLPYLNSPDKITIDIPANATIPHKQKDVYPTLEQPVDIPIEVLLAIITEQVAERTEKQVQSNNQYLEEISKERKEQIRESIKHDLEIAKNANNGIWWNRLSTVVQTLSTAAVIGSAIVLGTNPLGSVAITTLALCTLTSALVTIDEMTNRGRTWSNITGLVSNKLGLGNNGESYVELGSKSVICVATIVSSACCGNIASIGNGLSITIKAFMTTSTIMAGQNNVRKIYHQRQGAICNEQRRQSLDKSNDLDAENKAFYNLLMQMVENTVKLMKEAAETSAKFLKT